MEERERAPRPPRWAVAWLRRCTWPERLAEIEGDLEEQFIDQVAALGAFRARCGYVWEVFLLLKRQGNRAEPRERPAVLWVGYVKVALRNLRKRPGFSLINLLGLALGLSIWLLLMLLLGLFTIGVQTIRAARTNPIETLRYE